MFPQIWLPALGLPGSSLRVDLVLYHRLCWLSRGYGVCVPMHYLPGTLFRSKDHRRPQSGWGDLFPSAYLGLVPLYLHKIGKLRSYVLLYDLVANILAISELGCGTVRSRSNLLPSMRGRA